MGIFMNNKIKIYHASPIGGLKMIKAKTAYSYPELGEVVFGSPKESFAAIFGIGLRDDKLNITTINSNNLDSMVIQLTLKDHHIDISKPFSIYEIENRGFKKLPHKDNYKEMVYSGDCKVINEYRYNDWYVQMKTYDNIKFIGFPSISNSKKINTSYLYSNDFNDVKAVINSLSDEERKHLAPNGSFKDSSSCIYRKVYKDRNNKMGFINLEVYPECDETEVFVSMAVNPKYRGKNLPKIMVDDAIDFLSDKKVKKLIWAAEKNNIASNKAAINLGFKKVQSYGIFNEYQYTLKNKILKEGDEMGIFGRQTNNIILTEEEYNYIILEATDKPERMFKCPYCQKRFTRKELVYHIDEEHESMIPNEFTAARVVFNYINKKDVGHCVQCGKETPWNEDTWRYDRYCSQKCVDDYSKMAKSRMVKVHGKEHLLNDANHQTKMLGNRKISGKYKFTDGVYKTYCGSYENSLLEFLDKGISAKSKDVMSPGPTIEYEYNGEKHFWITDQYYIPANLVFDVKDGGSNPNTREMPEYRAKQEAKEKAIREQGQYNYIRLTDNNFTQLLLVLAEIKARLMDDNQEPVIHINEYMAMSAANPPVGISNDEGSYVIPCMMNNSFVDSAYTTDKYMTNIYKVKDWKIQKTTKSELEETYQLGNMYKYIGENEQEKRENFMKAYKEQWEVSADYFYLELSEKQILSKNQIIFDESFVETIDGYKESEERCNIIESTMVHQFRNSSLNNIYFPITNQTHIFESQRILSKYPKLDIQQDLNGYFVLNTVSECRSESFKEIKDISPYIYEILNDIKI